MNQQYQLPAPQQPPKKKHRLRDAAIFVFAVILFFAIVGSCADEESSSNKSSGSVSSSQTKTSVEVDPKSCEYIEYASLYVHKDEYKDKPVITCGRIAKIQKNSDGTVSITFKDDLTESTDSVCFNVEASKAGSVSSYYQGNFIEICGIVGEEKTSVLNVDNAAVTADSENSDANLDAYIANAKDNFISSCMNYSYEEISRTPDKYKDKKAQFTGQVLQCLEDENDFVIRLNLISNDGRYDDTILVRYTKISASEPRILEEDVITVYGTLEGITSYETVLGTTKTIPYMTARYVSINS